MATFAYNSAMSNEKLPRKQNANMTVASLFKGIDTIAEMEEAAFRDSGLNFSVCGHQIEHAELPTNFPSFLAAGTHNHASGE